MIHATYNVFPGHGYTVEVRDAGEVVDRYDAGDCHNDSQVYNTGDLDEETLTRFAKQTAKEILKDYGGTGEPERDEDIEA